MGLQAQPPLRVLQAIGYRGLDVVPARFVVVDIHRLQEKMLEIKVFKLFGRQGFLRVHKFQLVTGLLHKRAFGLRADTNPVDLRWHGQGSRGASRVCGPVWMANSCNLTDPQAYVVDRVSKGAEAYRALAQEILARR